MAESRVVDEETFEGAPGHWFLIVVLTLVYTYAFVDRVLLALLVEPIKADLGASDVQIGLLIGLAFAAFYAVFGLPAGHFVDRVNRTRLIGAASVIWALMTIVCGTAHALPQLFLGRMGVGLSEAILAPAALSLIRDAAPARSRGLAFSVFAMAPVAGSSLALIGGAALLKAAAHGAFASLPVIGAFAPWRAAMTLVGVCGLPLSLLVFLLREPARAVAPSHEPLLRGLWTAIRYMGARWRLYAPLLVFAAASTMMNFADSAWLPTALSRQWHVPPQDIGVPLGLMRLVGGLAGLTAGGFILSRMTRRAGDIRLVGALACVGIALGVAGAVLAPDHRLGYALAFADFLFFGLPYVVGVATLTEVTPVALIGRASAIYLLFQNLPGQALGPLVVALVSKASGGPAALGPSLVASQFGFAILAVVGALILGRVVARSRAVDLSRAGGGALGAVLVAGSDANA